MYADSNLILLTEINQRLSRIEKKLNIVEEKEITITDSDSSIKRYEIFALDELKLNQTTIDNQKSTLRNFLVHSKGIINKNTVRSFLDSNESDSWKSNQLKGLRKYIRDYLKLGNWIEDEFQFSNKTKVKIKRLPSDQQLVDFIYHLPSLEIQVICLLLHDSGMRIGEILSLKPQNLNFLDNMIDASQIHDGETKHSWISFFTESTSIHFQSYLKSVNKWDDGNIQIIPSNDVIFSVSKRTVQNAFQNASEMIDFDIRPHLLRTVFTDRCSKAGIKDKYIDAFCGRTSQGILAKHYTDYSPEALQEQYFKAEDVLTLKI